MNSINIRLSTVDDIAIMVALSKAKRLDYQKVWPKFWAHTKNAEAAQIAYFKQLLNDQEHILLVAEQDNIIRSFIIGKLIPAPAVYDPGGLTLLIGDFCV